MGDFDDKESHLAKGLQLMKNLRLGDGKWRNFPFYYAVYTLSELNLEPAGDELEYARPAMERYMKKPQSDIYSNRRAAIITRILESLN